MKTDAEIKHDVVGELNWEPILNGAEIGVAVHHGIVTLSGNVNTYTERIEAEIAALRVKGVKAVVVELEIRLAADGWVNDIDIAANVASTLKWNTAVPDDKIKVEVTGGRVYLEGEVDWNFQKEAAFNAIRHLKGVIGVSNLITVKPRVDTAILKDRIRQALERNADLMSGNIKIETLGNKVILKGIARSWAERKIIENAAWSAPGVVTVDDELIIA